MIIQNHNSLASLKLSIKNTKDEAQKTRIRAILYAQKGLTSKEIASIMVIGARTVRSWVNKYNQGGIDALRSSKGGRPKGNLKWKSEIFINLSKTIDKNDQYWSVPIMSQWIKQNYQAVIPDITIWYRITKLDYSHKSARPNPCKGDKKAQAKFKKGVSKRHWSR